LRSSQIVKQFFSSSHTQTGCRFAENDVRCSNLELRTA
jgi:hypothetical protein